jgi:hypothetical protein
MRRWLYWFKFPWGAAARRAEMLAEADQQQDDERKAAVRRIIDTARDWDGPTWGGRPAGDPARADRVRL